MSVTMLMMMMLVSGAGRGGGRGASRGGSGGGEFLSTAKLIWLINSMAVLGILGFNY